MALNAARFEQAVKRPVDRGMPVLQPVARIGSAQTDLKNLISALSIGEEKMSKYSKSLVAWALVAVAAIGATAQTLELTDPTFEVETVANT